MRKNQTFASPYFQHFQRKYPSKPVGQTPRNQRWRVAGEIPEHPRTSHAGLVHGENHGSQRSVFQPWSWFPEGGSEASPWGRMRAGELVESEQGLLSRWISGPGSFRKFDIQLDKVVCIYIYVCVCDTFFYHFLLFFWGGCQKWYLQWLATLIWAGIWSCFGGLSNFVDFRSESMMEIPVKQLGMTIRHHRRVQHCSTSIQNFEVLTLFRSKPLTTCQAISWSVWIWPWIILINTTWIGFWKPAVRCLGPAEGIHPPVITILIGGMVIPFASGWFMTLFCPH